MGTYTDDAQYIQDSHGTIYTEIPTDEEGQDNDERWALVEGKGLYHCKKVGGEWRFKVYNTDILLEGESSLKNVTTIYETLTTSTGTFDNVIVNNQFDVTGDSNSTFGSGVFKIVGGTLGEFPYQDNLKLTTGKLNTVQDIKNASFPRFNGLGLGGAGNEVTQAGAIDLDFFFHNGISAPGIINDVLTLVDDNFTNAASTTNQDGLDILGADPVIKNEIDQIKKINALVIGSAQWGHVADMNQNVGTDDPVTFSNLTLTDTHTHTLDIDSGTGHLRVGGPNDTHWSWDDTVGLQSDNFSSGGPFSGDGWGIVEVNNRHAFNIDDLYVRGTLSVYELLVQQVRATNGSLYVSAAAKIAEDGLKGIDVSAGTYELTFSADAGNDKGHPFANGDLIYARRIDFDEDGDSLTSDELRFTVTDISVGDSNQLKASVVKCFVGGADKLVGNVIDGLDDDEVSALLNGFDFARVGNTGDTPNRQSSLYLTSDDLASPFIDVIDDVASWDMFDGVSETQYVWNGSFDDLGDMDDGSTLYQASGDLPQWTLANVGTTGGIKAHYTGGINNGPYIELIDGDASNTSIVQSFGSEGNSFKEGVYYEIRWFAKLGTADTSTVSFKDSSRDHWLQPDGSFSDSESYQPWTSFCSGAVDLGTEWKECKWTFLADADVEQYSTDITLTFYCTGGNGTTSFIDNISIRPLGKVKARLGNLKGVGFSGHGLWSDNVFLEGTIHANSGYIGDTENGWNIDAYGLANLSNNSYIKAGNTSGYEGGGFYVNGQGNMSLGDASGNYLSYSAALSTLTVAGAIRVTDADTYDYRDSFQIVTPKTFHLRSEGGGSAGEAFLTDEETGVIETHNTRGYVIYLWNQEEYAFKITDSILIDKIQTDGNAESELSSQYSLADGWIWFDTWGGTVSGHDTVTEALIDMATFLEFVPVDTIVVILTADEPSSNMSLYGGSSGNLQTLSAETLAVRKQLTTVGAHYTEDYTSTYDEGGKITNAGELWMHGIDSLRYGGTYILIGRKLDNSNTDASEFVGIQHADDEANETSPLRVKIKVTGSKDSGDINSSIDILDVQNSAIMDLDSVEAKTFEYSRSDGFKIKPFQAVNASSSLKTYLIFTVPHIRPEDVQHVEIFMTSMNLNDEASIVNLRMNGIEIVPYDSDSWGAAQSEYGNDVQVNDTLPGGDITIADSLWNTTPGSVNVFDFSGPTDTDYNPMWIYQFKIMDKRTSKVYDNGYSGGDYPLSDNKTHNYSFEKSVVGAYTNGQSFEGWTTELGGGSTLNVAETAPRAGLKHLTMAKADGYTCNFKSATDFGMLADSVYRVKFYYRFPTGSAATGYSFRLYDTSANKSWKVSNDTWATGSTQYTYLWDTGTSTTVNGNEGFSSGGPYLHHYGTHTDTYNNDASTYDEWHAAEYYVSTGVADRTDVQIRIYVNGVGTMMIDEVTVIRKSATHNPGLYMTPEKLGYYNGVGGDGGWVNYMSDTGKVFFGDPHKPANFAVPSTGGSYIRYSPQGLMEINAEMVAGKITSKDGTTVFDLDADKLTVNDGETDRVILGKLA
jgi:hypothetical protein